MAEKNENFDSEKNPGIGIALAQVEASVMAHKELLGPPEIFAEVYNAISSAYMMGMQMVGRPLMPSDIYALQVIEGLAMQVIRPGSPAMLAAARGAVIAAGMDIAAGMAREAAQKAEEAKKEDIWKDDAAPAGDKPAKPEGETRGAPFLPDYIAVEGQEIPSDLLPGTRVLDWATQRHVGTINADGAFERIPAEKPAKPE